MKIGTVRELLARMDRYELREWEVYLSIHRIGDEYADLHFGVVAASAGNAGRLMAQASGAKLTGSPLKAEDFFPQSRGKPSRAELRAKMRAFVVGIGAVRGA